MRKTVLFIPGFQEEWGSRNYGAVLSAIEKAGYKAVFIPIQWKYRTINDWVGAVEGIYSGYDPENTILAGFSFGAMTALGVAVRRIPHELWLCSLSPYFSEDLPKLSSQYLSYIGKRRVSAFFSFSAGDLLPRVSCRTRIFVGANESQRISWRAQEACLLVKNGSLIVVPNAGHAVDATSYLDSINAEIQKK